MEESKTQISNGKKLIHEHWNDFKSSFSLKHVLVFWPVYCCWLAIMVAGAFTVFPEEVVSFGTYGNDVFAGHVKAFIPLFKLLIASFFLYFYLSGQWKKAAQFGGHFIAIWVFVPVLKNLAIFMILLGECWMQWNCGWFTFSFLAAKEGLF